MAIYFAFAGHLTRALLWPTLVGGLVYYGSYGYGGSMDNPWCPLYSLFILHILVTWYLSNAIFRHLGF